MTAARLSCIAVVLAHACSGSTEVTDNEQAEHCVLTDVPQLTLHPPVPRADAEFGFQVAIDGDVLVVGAPADPRPPNNFTEGAAYVFERSGASWVATAELRSAEFGFAYGETVAVAGDTIVVGDGNELDVFHRDATGWKRVDHIRQTAAFDGHIALTEDRLIVGVTGEDINIRFGFAFVYPRNGLTFGPPIPIDIGLPGQCEPAPSDCPEFGEAVAAEGDVVAVSAPGPGYNQVHVFRGGPTGLDHEAVLDAPSGRSLPSPFGFGETLAIDGDRIYVGDRFARNREGEVTVYAYADGAWKLEAQLPGNGDSDTSFGLALAASNRQLFVGAPFTGGFETGGPDGAVWLYTRDDDDLWQETGVVLDDVPHTELGRGIVVTPELAAVGAPREGDSPRSGAIYLYNFSAVRPVGCGE